MQSVVGHILFHFSVAVCFSMSGNPDTDAAHTATTCGALSLTWWKKRAAPAVGHAVFFGGMAGLLSAVYVCTLLATGPKDPRIAGLLVRGAVGGAAVLTAGVVGMHGLTSAL
jgi:hypothetical protein